MRRSTRGKRLEEPVALESAQPKRRGRAKKAIADEPAVPPPVEPSTEVGPSSAIPSPNASASRSNLDAASCVSPAVTPGTPTPPPWSPETPVLTASAKARVQSPAQSAESNTPSEIQPVADAQLHKEVPDAQIGAPRHSGKRTALRKLLLLVGTIYVLWTVIPWVADVSSVAYMQLTAKPLSSEQQVMYERIAATLPEEIFMKTTTESITQEYFVAIRAGRIFFKPRHGSDTQWRLLGADGLPQPGWFYFFWPTTWFPTGFVKPDAVVEISADDTNLNVMGSNGVVYYMKWPGFRWQGHYGLFFTLDGIYMGPAEFPVLPPNKGFAASHRGRLAKYYTDRCNHTFSMDIGVDTVYLLSEDGTELRYTDPWVPASFELRFMMPERNTFIAECMDAAGSVVMLMDRVGTIYTGLLDWDIVGNTIVMVYTHTCDSPNTYHTIPAEFWQRQPSTPARYNISYSISILQMGEGNWNKELRVAALDTDTNRAGYLYKSILDDEWKFREAQPLQPLKFVSASAPTPRRPFAGRTYAGTVDTYTVTVEGFTLFHTPATITFTSSSGEQLEGTLHTWGFSEMNRGTIMLSNTSTALGQAIKHELLQDQDEYPVQLSVSAVGLHVSSRFELLRSLVRVEHAVEAAIYKEPSSWTSASSKLKWAWLTGRHVEWLLSPA